jgi:hypothetical protein
MEVNISQLYETILSVEKKWKDNNRIIPSKLNLLETLLKGYEIDMNSIQFLYTVSLSGKWHPAAIAHFSQHWNDQGIARLKSDIDSSTKYTIRVFQLQILPLAINLQLRCRYEFVCVNINVNLLIY